MTDAFRAADLARGLAIDLAGIQERLRGLTDLVERLPAPSPAPDAAGHADRLYTKADAAERLSVSLRTVEQLLRGGQLAAVRIGTAVRIRASALDAYLARLDEEQNPPAPERPEFIRKLMAGGKEKGNVRYRA